MPYAPSGSNRNRRKKKKRLEIGSFLRSTVSDFDVRVLFDASGVKKFLLFLYDVTWCFLPFKQLLNRLSFKLFSASFLQVE
jgi:hypothetical protein